MSKIQIKIDDTIVYDGIITREVQDILDERIRQCIRDDNFEEFKQRLERYANLESKDVENNTFLLVAIKNNRPNMVKYLIGLGANVESENDSDGYFRHSRSPLLRAVQAENIESIKLLKAAGAEIEKTNKWGESPWSEALSLNNKAVIKALLD